jgi:hypothetical protein
MMVALLLTLAIIFGSGSGAKVLIAVLGALAGALAAYIAKSRGGDSDHSS